MSQGYLNRNVFERLYSTQTVASSRKQEIASANISKPKLKQTAEINPNSRLFASTEAYKHKHDDPLHAGENSMPSRKTTRQKRAVIPPAARQLPEKSPAAKTPAGKLAKATPSSSRSNNKSPLFSPQESVAPQTPASVLPSTPNTVQSTPSHSSVLGDATLPTLEDLVDMIEIPIEEKVTALFHSIGGGAVELNDVVHELEHRYPDLCTSTAVQNYTQRSDSPTGSLELADFQYFLLFLVYFHILYDDFVFIDDDDLRISKGEFEPVAERLHLFDDLEAAYVEMDKEQEGYIMFDALCAKCARKKHV
ncbi:hypothetical protein FisN_17Lh141 [Fistulifera solaris]|uniref:EF-hand domain-containing protein n=1 Tax=Fistulifera solaris TaxID=1519565 RepID=A0A1Z5K9M9_FISSO|nr:hypothetical protein FisN_17Lh141 [Fistulifera solaris]|eukprot:GAX22648.1 hypothetical protein FisN_17Lh141 [Fistulifera solaris]